MIFQLFKKKVLEFGQNCKISKDKMRCVTPYLDQRVEDLFVGHHQYVVAAPIVGAGG